MGGRGAAGGLGEFLPQETGGITEGRNYSEIIRLTSTKTTSTSYSYLEPIYGVLNASSCPL